MIIFITTLFISFLGSVHPGPLNVSVVETSLKSSLRAAVIMALGGIVPELIYSAIAVEGIMFFERNKVVIYTLQWLMVIVLLFMAINLFFTKPKPIKETVMASNYFLKGFVLSALNPQLLVFWILIVLYYQNFPLLKIDNLFEKLGFILGTATGAFMLNYGYAKWAFAKKDFIFSRINLKLFNYLIAGSFLAMAVFQVIKLVFV